MVRENEMNQILNDKIRTGNMTVQEQRLMRLQQNVLNRYVGIKDSFNHDSDAKRYESENRNEAVEASHTPG